MFEPMCAEYGGAAASIYPTCASFYNQSASASGFTEVPDGFCASMASSSASPTSNTSPTPFTGYPIRSGSGSGSAACSLMQMPTGANNAAFLSAMNSNSVAFCQYVELQRFYSERVQQRKAQIARSVREVVIIVQEILKEVEQQEPRFISTLVENQGRFDGLKVMSPVEFEVCLYLNQMAVFNFLDDGTIPGCAVLKLSDGRKRSMSLWVEFITASGYLSARKIRSRFQALVAAAVEKSSYRDILKLASDGSEVKLQVRDRYLVHLVPSFRCLSLWPRSASQWPAPQIPWPMASLVQEVKTEGFTLLSKDSPYFKDKQQQQQTSDGDAWILSFDEAEWRLLQGGCRRKLHSVLKALCDRHLGPIYDNPISNYHVKTLVLNECEKHPYDAEWEECCLPDRLSGVLMELIYRLQNRRFPHYFLANLDLFRGKSPQALNEAAKQTWRLLRELQTSPKTLLNPDSPY